MIKNFIKNILIKAKYPALTRKKFAGKVDGVSKRKRLIMIGTPNFGNLGDHAIAEAETKFIADFFPEYEYIEISFLLYKYDKAGILQRINSDDVILLHGGGYLGTLWVSAQEMVEDVVDTFKENQIILFPQTIFFDSSMEASEIYERSKNIYEKHPRFTMFLRDLASYHFAQENYPKINIVLVPDIVTYLEESESYDRNGVLLCMRNDKEKVNYSEFLRNVENILESESINFEYTDTNLDMKIDEYSRDMYLQSKFEEFSKAKLVITDRLHGMLFCLITGTPCLALNNISKKVEGAYYWLSDNENFAHIELLENDDVENFTKEELEKVLEKALNKVAEKYSNTYLLENLSPIKKIISLALEN